MNNKDMPAMPTPTKKMYVGTDDDGKEILQTVNGGNGLTKREHFAGLALQGILSNPTCKTGQDQWKECIARDALLIADALLSALEETK